MQTIKAEVSNSGQQIRAEWIGTITEKIDKEIIAGVSDQQSLINLGIEIARKRMPEHRRDINHVNCQVLPRNNTDKVDDGEVELRICAYFRF